jgi:6,7-dimethyl-8-ribityllumazine synthase
MNGHEGRGIGIVNKIAAYQLQEEGLDTFAANRALGFGDDERTYDAAAYILNELGVNSIRLLSNNPDKLFSLRTLGIKVTDAIPLASDRNEYNEQYLDTKANNGHAALKREEGRHMEVLEGAKVTDPVLNAKGMHIGIVASRLFDEGVTDQMIQHAVEEAKRHGVKKVDIERVYGSGELPYAAHILAKTGKYDALVAFGIILRGGTMHFETVMQRVTHGLLRVSMESDVPIADGVTTVFEMPQARVRAGGPGSHEDRGAAAMYAALELAMLKKKYTASVGMK